MATVGLRQILDFAEMRKIFRDFSVTTDYDIALFDLDGNELLAHRRGVSVCSFSRDRAACAEKIRFAAEKSADIAAPYIYDTECGLVMCAVALSLDNMLLGSVVCGPVILWDADELAEAEFRQKNECLDERGREIRLKDICRTTCERLTGATNLLSVLTERMLRQAAERGEGTALYLSGDEELRRVMAEKENVIASVKQLEKKADYHRYPVELEKEMIAHAQLGDRSKAIEILNHFLGEIFSYAGGDLDVIKAKLYEFCAFLTRSTVDAGVPLSEILGVVKKSGTLLEEQLEFQDICVVVTDVLNSLIDAIYQRRNCKTASKHLTNAIAVIHAEYACALSLGDVARKVFVNSYYLSHLFREEMQTTFSEYLTKVRLGHAKELLKQDKSIKSVAELSGFGDSNYFTKIFKRSVGVTPMKYKQIWNQTKQER